MLERVISGYVAKKNAIFKKISNQYQILCQKVKRKN